MLFYVNFMYKYFEKPLDKTSLMFVLSLSVFFKKSAAIIDSEY